MTKPSKPLGARIAGGFRDLTGQSIDSNLIRELAAVLDETSLTEIEVEKGGLRVRVARQGVPMGHQMIAAPAPMTAPAAPATGEMKTSTAPHPGTVTSPMVGTVYVSPQPGSPPFVKVGDSVKEGQTLLIVEAMKTMNPITAPKAGKVLEVNVVDAMPVEFGQALLVIG